MTAPLDGLPRGIGRPATAALAEAGYTRLDQLAGVPRRDVAELHGVGPTALRVLGAALAAHGLSFG
ncbi:DNA-binding protein [Blastococcus sp. PRF04-17]|uniref:DNA-binding protein n=1 Tax=Blastococcus sp. PRF04-17 TaxID=2933797 RepID=UPI001FF3FDBE|nr:DNA-binding protein [Blastococcus sp. PRF04-17]UOY03509.1 DNA-binding protein [Blastococcus sp. PRF04-17]